MTRFWNPVMRSIRSANSFSSVGGTSPVPTNALGGTAVDCCGTSQTVRGRLETLSWCGGRKLAEEQAMIEKEMPTCDKTLESRLSPVPHSYDVVGTEEGSLSDGGTYDVLECRRCGRVAYSMVAD